MAAELDSSVAQPASLGPEVPEADALEQRQELTEDEFTSSGGVELLPLEADPADVVEQNTPLPLDDDYRTP